MKTNPFGKRGMRRGTILGMLRTRRRPDLDRQRIDVRRGDRAYERVVGEERTPGDESVDRVNEHELSDERPDGTA